MYDGEDYISTHGSTNFTLGGLILNGESFAVHKSWYDDEFYKNVIKQKNIFDEVFEKKHDQYQYLDADKILDVVDKIGDNLEKNQLVQNSLELLQLNSRVQEKLKEIKLKEKKKILIIYLSLILNQNFRTISNLESTRFKLMKIG